MQVPQIDAPAGAATGQPFDGSPAWEREVERSGAAIYPSSRVDEWRLSAQPAEPVADDTNDDVSEPYVIAYARWLLGELDWFVTGWMTRFALRALQLAVGVIFLWFGSLKFVPGLSPAEELVVSTAQALLDPIGLPMPGRLVIVILATWEVAVGFGMLLDRHRRVVVWMLILHMFSTALPLLLLPGVVWTRAPFGLTLEGQYIVKNLVILAAATAIGATVRGVQPTFLSSEDGSDHEYPGDEQWKPAEPEFDRDGVDWRANLGDRSVSQPPVTAPRVWVVDESGSLLATYELDGYYGNGSHPGHSPGGRSTNIGERGEPSSERPLSGW